MRAPRCEAVQLELKAYLDGALGPVARFAVASHLKRCDACRLELEAVKRMGKELREMSTALDAGTDTLDPALRARILAAIPNEPSRARYAPDFRPARRPMLLASTLLAAGLAAIVFWPRAYTGSTARQLLSHRYDKQATASGSGGAPGPAAATPASADIQKWAIAGKAQRFTGGGIGGGGGIGTRGGGAGSAADNAPGDTVAAAGSPGAPISMDGAARPIMPGATASIPIQPQRAQPAPSALLYNSTAEAATVANPTFRVTDMTRAADAVIAAAGAQQGKVVSRTGPTDGSWIELSVSIPAVRVSAMLSAIPRVPSRSAGKAPALRIARVTNNVDAVTPRGNMAGTWATTSQNHAFANADTKNSGNMAHGGATFGSKSENGREAKGKVDNEKEKSVLVRIRLVRG